MAGLTINPNFAQTLRSTAASKVATVIAQHASVPAVQAAQRIFQAADLLTSIFGAPFENMPNPLLGHMTPKQVMELQRQMRALSPTRKNLFYIRITDESPPDLAEGLSDVPYWMLDLLALDVSYGPNSITGDKVQIGSAVLDRVTGVDATEIQITTLDDERGTLKRWFEAKQLAVAAEDGTFGLPKDYCVDIEIVHGVPSPVVGEQFTVKAFKSHFRMRPVSLQHELSRRDQAFEELQMTFTQFDTWIKKKR